MNTRVVVGAVASLWSLAGCVASTPARIPAGVSMSAAASVGPTPSTGGDQCSALAASRPPVRAVVEALVSDPARGVPAATCLCERGMLEVCVPLGSAHFNGSGVPVDLLRALELYQRACEGGVAEGCCEMGIMLINGQGIAVDVPRARQVYQHGCEAGARRCCSELGVMVQNGEGGPRDPAAAARLFAHACELGHARGCTNLGRVLFANDPASRVRAAEMFERGCAGGDELGCQLRQRMAAGGGP